MNGLGGVILGMLMAAGYFIFSSSGDSEDGETTKRSKNKRNVKFRNRRKFKFKKKMSDDEIIRIVEKNSTVTFGYLKNKIFWRFDKNLPQELREVVERWLGNKDRRPVLRWRFLKGERLLFLTSYPKFLGVKNLKIDLLSVKWDMVSIEGECREYLMENASYIGINPKKKRVRKIYLNSRYWNYIRKSESVFRECARKHGVDLIKMFGGRREALKFIERVLAVE